MRTLASSIPLPAVVEEVVPMTPKTSLYRLRLPVLPDGFVPGCFVQLSVPGGGEIPVSVAAPPRDGVLELCIRVVGRVTGMLEAVERGRLLGVRGFFGNGFPVAEMRQGDMVLLAGGLGIAPLRSLLLHVLTNRDDFGTVSLLYGARSSAEFLFRDELKVWSERADINLDLCTECVSEGDFCDCTVGLLPSLLRSHFPVSSDIWAAACGPPSLYAPLVSVLLDGGVSPRRILLSLERRMKCGVGKCCHCGLGTFLCCTDGPVFRHADLVDAGVTP